LGEFKAILNFKSVVADYDFLMFNLTQCIRPTCTTARHRLTAYVYLSETYM